MSEAMSEDDEAFGDSLASFNKCYQAIKVLNQVEKHRVLLSLAIFFKDEETERVLRKSGQ